MTSAAKSKRRRGRKEQQLWRSKTTKRILAVVYICVFISGAAGLIYEVVWSRQLNQFLGITTYAHTAVLTAYMLGLAAGSLVIGRIADRLPTPLRLYGWLEIGIGLFALITPWLFILIQNIYTALAPTVGLTSAGGNLLRFTLALLSLLIPTFMMGGTLPILVRGLTANIEGLAKSTGWLYGLNTLGAALGSFAAGYILLPNLGMRGSLFLTVILSAGVGLTVLFLHSQLPPPLTIPVKKETEAAQEEPEEAALSRSAAWLFLLGFAISGFASLAYELAWIRALTLVIGSSVYAFSTVLATYLAGIAAGSLVYSRFPGRPDTSSRLRLAALFELGICLTAILSLFFIGRLPDIFLAAYSTGMNENYSLFQLLYFSLSFLVMFLPTFLIGALFPLATAVWTRESASVGRGVGTAYAANSTGNILGSILTGLVLLPILGVQNTLFLAAGISAALSALFWLLRPAEKRLTHRLAGILVPLGIFALAVFIVPDWNEAVMSAGVYSRPENFLDSEQQGMAKKTAGRNIIYYDEGIDGVVSVIETPRQRMMVINGKTDATSSGDLPTQYMLGQLPLLIKPDAQDVLIIGLGSGATAGAVSTHENVSRIDVLEISPEVVEASDYFRSVNHNVLDDPRTNLIVADARNFLMANPHKYDIIISEPSNPWISGISNLFTREFFELEKSRLVPGGVLAQWFHTYDMSVEDLQSVLETYRQVFPYVTIWKPILGDLIMIGSEEPHAIDFRHLQEALNEDPTSADLKTINLGTDQLLVDIFLLDDTLLPGFTEGAWLNTDDRPHLEFNAPRYLYSSTANQALGLILLYLEGQKFAAPVSGLVWEEGDRLLAPFISLEISSPGESTVDELRSTWLVERKLQEVDEGENEVVVGNQGFITWNQTGARNQLIATRFVDQADIPALDETLASVMLQGIDQEGTVELPGSWQGQWAVGPGEQENHVAAALSWICPGDAGDIFNYVYLQLLPDPGHEQWPAMIGTLAEQFHCQEK